MSVQAASKRLLLYCFIAIAVVVSLIPIFWTVMSSIKADELIWRMPPVWLFRPTFAHWENVLNPAISNFPNFVLNSLIIGGGATLISLIIGIPAAYAFSQFQFRAKQPLFFWILTTRMAPPFCITIPMFMLWKRLGLIDTHVGLIIMYISFDLGFVIWLMKNFFNEIPKELVESAQIDGCSLLQAMIRIALPLVRPGLVTAAFVSFLFNWNEFLVGVIFTREVAKTVQVGLTSFVGFNLIRWGELAVGTLIAAVPVIVLGLILQRYLVSGLTLGAMKE